MHTIIPSLDNCVLDRHFNSTTERVRDDGGFDESGSAGLTFKSSRGFPVYDLHLIFHHVGW